MSTRDDLSTIALDGASLTLNDLVAIARGSAGVTVTEEAFSVLSRAQHHLAAAREEGSVYGANTGVGANRSVDVGKEHGLQKSNAHAQRLLNSHCAGIGEVEDDVIARAAMAIRLNQFLAGGSGISSSVGHGLLEALQTRSIPKLHRLGAIGTADLAALAELALTLAGDRPWRSGGIAPVALADSDALPFMSSSAVTIATATMGVHDLTALLRSGTVVAALSFLALEGSSEAYDETVQCGRLHPHQASIAYTMRNLVRPTRAGHSYPAARLQDPFGLRVVPQVHAPALDSIYRLADILETEVNAAVENPLVTPEGVRHHGQFHLATLSSALDHARASIYPVLTLSAARLGLLLRPEMTRLTPFLAADLPGSSGLMITEYVVQDILAGLRIAVAPVSCASVSISLGMEEHASFATQGARLLRDMAATAPTIFAIEVIAAVRALREAPERLHTAAVRPAYEFLAKQFDANLADRPIGDDVEQAIKLLPDLDSFFGDGL